MTIDDLKTLMDEFEPASLLPELDTILGKAELITRIAVMIGPIILLILGLAYLLLSPKEANYYFGYRCYFGMGSVEAWRFTQRLAGIIWTLLGLALTAVMFLVCGGFRGMEMMEMMNTAVTCVLWEAGLVLVSWLAINTIVALRFNAKGNLRKSK